MKNSETIVSIPLEKLHVSKLNTRQPKASHPDVKELANSLAANGQTTPAIVRPFPEKDGHFEIAAGARRRIAAAVAKLETLDCIIREIPDTDFEELILIENLQRTNPDAKAEAKNLARLVENEGGKADISALASRLGKSTSWVARRIRLVKMLPALRKQWDGDHLMDFTVQMMELLGSLPKDVQTELAEKLDGHDFWKLTQCKTHGELQTLLERDYSCRLDSAPFPLDDPQFHGACGVDGCGSSSDDSPLLFDFEDDKGKSCARCLNSSCFLGRLEKFRTHQLSKAEKGDPDLIYLSRNQQQQITREDGTVIYTIADWELDRKHGLKIGKKSDEESRRAIDLSNPNKPRSVYLTPIKRPTNGQTPSVEPLPNQSKEELKRERHQARRWVKVHEELCKAVRAAALSDLKPDLFQTVAFFGLSYSLTYSQPGQWDWFDTRETAQPFDRYSAEDVTLEERAWQGLKSIFITRMGFNRVIDCLQVLPEMKRIAGLIGYDLTDAKNRADKVLPPPKSWGEVDLHTLEAAA